MKKSLAFVICSACTGMTGLSTSAWAEEVAVPVGQQGQQNVQTPARGLDKSSVVARYGEPSSRKPPVGDPPISRWVYNDYTVYFEHDYVIHSVRHPAN